jgi:hypothetical protein
MDDSSSGGQAAVAEPAVTVGFNVVRNNAHNHLRAW